MKLDARAVYALQVAAEVGQREYRRWHGALRSGLCCDCVELVRDAVGYDLRAYDRHRAARPKAPRERGSKP